VVGAIRVEKAMEKVVAAVAAVRSFGYVPYVLVPAR
jgi:hypothetical protein